MNIENVSNEEKGNGVLADVIGSSSEWNRLAEAIKDEFGESIIDEGDEDNAYDWWLTDVTVNDIIDFLKNYR
jgi:hypothetical protein